MTSPSSFLVRPLSSARCRWPTSCFSRPRAIRVAQTIRLRSRLERPGRSQTARDRQLGSVGMDFSQLQYFPLALPHFSLLIGIFLVLVAWIEVHALRVAYMSIGLGPRAALLLLLASLGGSYLNIPVARLAGHQIVSGQEVLFFGMRHIIPVVVEWPDTIVAVNVGGAVIPGLLSLYLLVRYRLWVRGLVAVAGVAVVCHILAEPVRGLGIALPVFVPPVFKSTEFSSSPPHTIISLPVQIAV